jgi:short-subunit dehydrogenase
MTAAFANQGFIVTGAASGIGKATAQLLHQRGAKLVLWDQDAAHLSQAAGELNAQPAQVDVTRPHEVRSAMSQAVEALGTLNGVVHSAGILRAGVFEQVDIEAHRRMIEVNLFGTLNVVYAALPHLRHARGSLTLLASTAAFYGPPEYTSYGAAKAGVLAFAQALRVELNGSGVHIGVVCPLFVTTPMLTGYNANTRLRRSHSILFDTQSPEQVAPVILDGITRRRFLIYPGWRPRLLFWLSRYLHILMHPTTVMTYRQGGG